MVIQMRPNSGPMSDSRLVENDSTKPVAMAIPKEGFLKREDGRHGPIFPGTPACYGFKIIAKVIPGREPAFYEYSKTIEKAASGQPDCLAVLKLHYLRWVLFPIKGETYFMYQGIFDTDSDKYTEDAVTVFTTLASARLFNTSKASPGLADECAGLHQTCSGSPVPELPGIRRVSLCERRRDQESAEVESRILEHAGPDAVS
jgi:hypothetical protein